MEKGRKFFTKCQVCKVNTKHEVLEVVKTSGDPNEYFFEDFDSIIRCCGCEDVSFLTRHVDYENLEEDDSGRPVPSVSDTRYPNIFEKSPEIDDFELVPEIVEKIYRETIGAIRSSSYIISGVGMRTIIEAICNDKEIIGKDLKARINKLSSLGHISKEDAKRLHAIRFLGNDSAHDIKPARKSALLLALRIVNHILESVYTLSVASVQLDTSIETYEDLEPFIKISLRNIDHGAILTLRGILGKNARRLDNIEALEAEFNQKIELGNFPSLGIEQTKDEKGRFRYKLT